MTFELSQYYRIVWTSIGGILWFLIICAAAIFTSIKAINKAPNSRGINILVILFFISLFVRSVYSNYPTLKNGGIAFLKEKDSEPLVCQGEIESITEISELLPNHHSFGSDIVIDGVTYIAAEEGDFEVGDVVEIHYLENSKFVLKIERHNNE